MPRGLRNWNFRQVTRFLKDHNFTLNHVEGSHYFYTGYKNKSFRQVSVPFHGGRSIHPKTMKSIINQSGISINNWLNK